jgi:hypothetical protein
MNYKDLPLTSDKVKRLATFARMYRAAGIFIEPVPLDSSKLAVCAEQRGALRRLTVSAASCEAIDKVNPGWIAQAMNKYGIKPKHTATYTRIDKATVSAILSGQKELTKWHKATFYYLSKHIEHAQFSQPTTPALVEG